MIIRRYLMKQVMSTSIVVVVLLTMMMMGSRLIKYFGFAAQGRFDPNVLFSLVVYLLPQFLTLILPLGFFIALMLVFGRLYVDHEMAVLNASGVSRGRMVVLLLPLTAFMLAIQAALMLWLTPAGLYQFEQLKATQSVRAGFDLVRPKEFVSSGAYTIYAGDLSEDRRNLKDVFFYQHAAKPDKPDVIILAQEATRVEVPNDNASVVDLVQGRRYEIYPGKPKYLQAEFASYRLRLETGKDQDFTPAQVEDQPTLKLWEKRNNPVIASELGWRIFVPFSIVIAFLMAIGLSQVSPRQGRYHRLLPAILIFSSLIVLMISIKTRVSKDQLGMWAYPAVLLIYGTVTVFLARNPNLAPRIKDQIKRVSS